jgi:protein phosphatase PTC1
MNSRVNGECKSLTGHETISSSLFSGVLAVTRSLGDASMKEFVVGSPYTTETALDENDEFLIVACDGVSTPVGSSDTALIMSGI